ncbi:MAG: T9SS type A sorting domain-containing protein, partial [Flavobacteriales bacterium]|nr:T9SS type A sorting domain-containing protein [Flavobacteriales bacterium]
TVFELRVDSQDVSFDSLALCQGDSILISGNYHTSSGNYLDSLLNNSGCDSLANISLSFLPISQYWDTVNLCFGDSFLIGSSFYADSGSVTDTIIDTSFCFINTYQLYILDTSQTNINYDLCQGDSIFLQGGFQTSSGIFYDTTLNQNGCDSIVISHLNYEIIDTSTTLYADSIVANMSNVNYQWFNCNTGTALIGETNKSLEPSSQGVYQVLLTGQYCQDTSACIYFNTNPVGLEALKEEIAYRVDSKNGIVHFFGLDPITQVEIYNVQGQLVFFKETVKSGQVQLPNPGIYMLRLKAENEETLIKAAYLGN